MDEKLESPDPDVFLYKAKRLVMEHHNALTDEANGRLLTVDDIYIVWFAKVLKNWKALVSTGLANGLYYEVTYNGEDYETYLDVYAKITNNTIPDFETKENN